MAQGKWVMAEILFQKLRIQTRDRWGEICSSSQKQTNQPSLQSLFPREPGELSCWPEEGALRLSLQAEKEKVSQAEVSKSAVASVLVALY